MERTGQKHANVAEAKILPAYPTNSICLFPHTVWVISSPDISKKEMAWFNKVLNEWKAMAVIMFASQRPNTQDVGGFLNIGTLVSLERKDDSIILAGKGRVRINKISPDKVKGTWLVEIENLTDDPPEESVPETELPMILGALEATSIWLKRWPLL